jgi:microcystin-dependent protein
METLVGTIALFPFPYTPVGWVECNGQMLSIHRNSVLYSTIGNIYGGDGNSTFAVPDLREKVPGKDLRYCIAVQGAYPDRA